MTNEERIARLDAMIREAQEKRRELSKDSQDEQINRWENELHMTVEETSKAHKGEGGSGF